MNKQTMMDFIDDCFNAVANDIELSSPMMLDLQPYLFTFVQWKGSGVLTVTARLPREVAEVRFFHMEQLLSSIWPDVPATKHLRLHQTVAGAFTIVVTVEKKS